jgi:hypothetical protein
MKWSIFQRACALPVRLTPDITKSDAALIAEKAGYHFENLETVFRMIVMQDLRFYVGELSEPPQVRLVEEGAVPHDSPMSG